MTILCKLSRTFVNYILYDCRKTTIKEIIEDNQTVFRALLLKRIEAEQGDMSKYHERQAKAAAQKADLEAQLIDNQVIF
jgi:hypothetical protein